MIGLDTNVIVRYIMQDDPAQAALATRCIESLSETQPGYITLVSVVELVWILGSCFGLQRPQIVLALESLLQTRELQLERADVVWRAVQMFRSGGGDFADCLIERLASVAGCRHVVTFDEGAVRHAGMTLLS